MCYEFEQEMYRRMQEQQRRAEEERRAKEEKQPTPAKPNDAQPEPVPV